MTLLLLPNPTLPRIVQEALHAPVCPTSRAGGLIRHWQGYTGPVYEHACRSDDFGTKKVQTLKVGYQFFTYELDQVLASGKYSFILMGHEPTGIYHEPWMYNLLSHY